MDVKLCQLMDNLGQYILLNAYSTDSSGLYNGKAGLSIVLFELSAISGNKLWEDHAYELICQALITTDLNTSFTSGLSGIGYSLLYLINNNFIDADFDELFGEKRNLIEKILNSEIEKMNYELLLSEIYYLNALDYRRNENEEKLLKNLNEGIIKECSKKMQKALCRENRIHKVHLKRVFQKLLKQFLIIDIFFNPDIILNLCLSYSDLYEKRILSSDLIIGIYLEKIAKKHKDEKLMETALSNINKGIKNYQSEVFTFEEKIELLFLLPFEECAVENVNIFISKLTSSIIGVNGKTIEQSITDSLTTSVVKYGLGHGVSRILLFLIYQYYITLGKKTDVKRLWNLLV